MRQLRVLFGAVLVTALAATGYFVTRGPGGQPVSTLHLPDRRCRSGCTDSALLRILPSVSPSLIAAGQLQTTKGVTVTTTRASNKTCTKADGTLTYLGSNMPCVEAAGLLVEGQSTNLLTWSGALDNAAWTVNASTKTANAAVAPDGTTTATKIQATAGLGYHAIVAPSNAAVATSTNSFSVYLKQGTARYGAVWWANTGGGAAFDLQTGATMVTSASFTSSITASGNGFWRVSFTGASNIASDSPIIMASDGSAGFAGPAVQWTAAGTEYIYAVGADLEAQSFASSYIPTTTTSATRAGDLFSITLPSSMGTSGCARARIVPNFSGTPPNGADFLQLGPSAYVTLMYEPGDNGVASFVGSQYLKPGPVFSSGVAQTYVLNWSNTGATMTASPAGTSGSTSFASSGTSGKNTINWGVVTGTSRDPFWISDIAIGDASGKCN